MWKLVLSQKMTRKYIEEMTDTKKQDKNVTIESSDSSSVEEPDSPVIRSYKPLNSPPHLILDPQFSEEEDHSDSNQDETPFVSSVLAWPVKKLICKKPMFDKKIKNEKNNSAAK